MVDSITSTSANSVNRLQTAQQAASLRNNTAAVNSIVQTQQKSSSATSPVLALAVPQTSKSGGSSRIKVPRGSLIDVVA